MFEEAIKLCFARDVSTVSVIQRELERGINSCPNWPYIRCFVPIYEKPDLELGVSTVLVPRQRHVSFENEKFEDKIDYDERSELPSFDYMFDLSMLDDWEDNLVDIA